MKLKGVWRRCIEEQTTQGQIISKAAVVVGRREMRPTRHTGQGRGRHWTPQVGTTVSSSHVSNGSLPKVRLPTLHECMSLIQTTTRACGSSPKSQSRDHVSTWVQRIATVTPIPPAYLTATSWVGTLGPWRVRENPLKVAASEFISSDSAGFH